MCESHQPGGGGHAHHHIEFLDFSAFGEWGLVLSLFITGLSGSFLHCVGMCGPFAVAISQMRLMELPPSSMSHLHKIRALFALPYYLGKSVTYVFLMLILYSLSSLLKNMPIVNYIGFGLLTLVCAGFIILGLTSSVSFAGNRVGVALSAVIKRMVGKIGSQFGWRGFATGLILGLIPCGLVVASITQAVAVSHDLFFAVLAVFAFGLATVPGLFLVSVAGGVVHGITSKKIFRIIYATVMFYNAYVLMCYALKLV